MTTDDDAARANPPDLDDGVRRALSVGRLEEAVTLLWHAHYAGLTRYLVASGASPEDVPDAIGRIFARVVVEIEAFRPERPSGWLYTLARFELLTVVKERGRARERQERLAVEAPLQASPPGPEACLHAAQIVTAIEAVRAGLDPVGQCICDLLHDHCSDAEAIDRIEASTGERLTPSGLRNRRGRLRLAVSKRLREEGLL